MQAKPVTGVLTPTGGAYASSQHQKVLFTGARKQSRPANNGQNQANFANNGQGIAQDGRHPKVSSLKQRAASSSKRQQSNVLNMYKHGNTNQKMLYEQ